MARKTSKLENPLEKSKKMPTFEERYEESLIKQLFEDELKKKAKKLQDENEEEADYYEEKRQLHHQKRDGDWDVLIDEEIMYFDPELSYEITGYRPITMTDGLDFDPKPFREAAECYEKNKYYTSYLPGSKPYKEYWREQLKRCTEGYTVGKYRITGDHYFFLNFYRMQTVNLDSAKKTTGRGQSFPSFLSKQYEFFHYVELCEYIGKDCILLKARGLGFSEILACIGVRPFITTREFTTMYTAAADNQLSPVLDKCWTQLDWLNMNTNGGMKRSRMKINNAKEKRASLLTSDNIEYGRMSNIQGVVADSPRKVRGSRVERLIFEECFGKDTLVIMSDYSRKKIQDIKIGDFVMGISGSPQEVISTCSGIDDLYKIKQRKGSDYITNSKHKLYFEHRPRVGNQPDQIKLMTPADYLGLSNYNKRTTYGLKSSGLYRTDDRLGIDPYYFGLWLGDGFSAGATIVINETDDQEIKDYVLSYYNSLLPLNPKFKISIRNNNCKTSKILRNYAFSGGAGKNTNCIQVWLRKNNLIHNKHIPDHVYNISMNDRLKILAGIIDTDGNLKKGTSSYSFSYEISMVRKHLILQILELARSCGFDVNYDERIMKNGYKKGSNSYRVKIRGDLKRIPVRVSRKKLPDDYTQTTNALSTSISVESAGKGEYYGFTLRSYGLNTDHLFLLDDYTIVHNCGSNPNSVTSWIQGNALVELGGTKIGTRIGGGKIPQIR